MPDDHALEGLLLVSCAFVFLLRQCSCNATNHGETRCSLCCLVRNSSDNRVVLRFGFVERLLDHAERVWLDRHELVDLDLETDPLDGLLNDLEGQESYLLVDGIHNRPRHLFNHVLVTLFLIV